MTDRTAAPAPPRAPYAPPTLKRFGSVTDLTLARRMVGRMDGGSNMTRTG